MDTLEEAFQRLTKYQYLTDEEWETLPTLVSSESEWILLLKWIFIKSLGYWYTRARAGRILLQHNEQETWEILEKLVDSSDPDDNGTALTLFEELNDPRGLELARRWLSDENPF
jgi:hypothetical protein